MWRRHEKGNLNSAVREDLPSNLSGQNEFSLSILHSITWPHYLTFSYLLLKPQHPPLFKLVVRVQHGDLCCSLSHNLIVESSRISTSFMSTTQTLLYGASCADVTLSWMSTWTRRTPLKKSRPPSRRAWNEMFKWKNLSCCKRQVMHVTSILMKSTSYRCLSQRNLVYLSNQLVEKRRNERPVWHQRSPSIISVPIFHKDHSILQPYGGLLP